MKKRAILELIGCIFLLSSCTSDIKPIADDLATFTVKNEDGDVLIGLKSLSHDSVIVTPDRFESIDVDNYTVACKLNEHDIIAYKLNGEKLGEFDFFTHWYENGEYYLGSSYMEYCYYFPQKDVVIRATTCLAESDYLFLKKENRWQIYDYTGQKITTIALDEKSPIVALLKVEKPKRAYYYIKKVTINERVSYHLYNALASNKLKVYNPLQWQTLISKAKDSAEIDDFSYFILEKL